MRLCAADAGLRVRAALWAALHGLFPDWGLPKRGEMRAEERRAQLRWAER